MEGGNGCKKFLVKHENESLEETILKCQGSNCTDQPAPGEEHELPASPAEESPRSHKCLHLQQSPAAHPVDGVLVGYGDGDGAHHVIDSSDCVLGGADVIQ